MAGTYQSIVQVVSATNVPTQQMFIEADASGIVDIDETTAASLGLSPISGTVSRVVVSPGLPRPAENWNLEIVGCGIAGCDVDILSGKGHGLSGAEATEIKLEIPTQVSRDFVRPKASEMGDSARALVKLFYKRGNGG